MRQLTGEIFQQTSELESDVEEDGELAKMRLQLQREAAELDFKMAELERQMVREEYKADIRESRLFELQADINLRKQQCNEMEVENRRLVADKSKMGAADRTARMALVGWKN